MDLSVNDQKYDIGILPRDPFLFMNSCRHTIGKIGGFCIMHEYPINYQGTAPENLKIGTYYVVKVPKKTVFFTTYHRFSVYSSKFIGTNDHLVPLFKCVEQKA